MQHVLDALMCKVHACLIQDLVEELAKPWYVGRKAGKPPWMSHKYNIVTSMT